MAKLRKKIVTPGVKTVGRLDGKSEKDAITPARIKTWVDNFHSTKIYEFRMKCPHCPQKFVVRTDPENC